MAFDGFMWFSGPKHGAEDIHGETLDKQFQPMKAFNIKSFTLDVENPCSIGSAGGGAGLGKAKLNPFKVSKWTDACSPRLFTTCVKGGHYDEACIAVRKSGESTDKGTGLEYLRFIFKMVFVTNIEWSGESEDELPGENLQFAYGAMTIRYTPQSKEGGKKAPIAALWNQVHHTGDSDHIKDF